MISDDEMKNKGKTDNSSDSNSRENEVNDNSQDDVKDSEVHPDFKIAKSNIKNDETIKIAPSTFKRVLNTDKIQHMDEIGNPDNFEDDLALAHKNDKQKEAEILEMDRDIQNGDEIDEDSVKSTFLVGELGDENDIDILPMILKRNSQLQKKYDIDDLKKIKINKKNR